jgi:hypothetical protein
LKELEKDKDEEKELLKKKGEKWMGKDREEKGKVKKNQCKDLN